jgi:hypothetical protein
LTASEVAAAQYTVNSGTGPVNFWVKNGDESNPNLYLGKNLKGRFKRAGPLNGDQPFKAPQERLFKKSKSQIPKGP